MLPTIFGENLFDDFFSDDFQMFPMWNGRSPLYGKNAKNLMKTDVRETENSYELDIDLPGFKKEEIGLDLRNGYLTISASKGLDKDTKDKEGKYIRQERYAGSCSRSFYIGTGVESKDVTAKYEDGILKISFPKETKKELPASTTIQIGSKSDRRSHHTARTPVLSAVKRACCKKGALFVFFPISLREKGTLLYPFS